MVKEKAGTALETAANRDDGKKRLVELRTDAIKFFQSLSDRTLVKLCGAKGWAVCCTGRQ